MRQTKLSDLIHNSEGFQNIDSCTVDIHFEEIIDIVNENLIFRTIANLKRYQTLKL